MLSVLDAFHVSPRYPCVDPTTPHGQGAPAQPPDTPRYHACTAGITLTSMLQSHQGVQPDFFLCHHVPGCWKAAKNGSPLACALMAMHSSSRRDDPKSIPYQLTLLQSPTLTP